MAATAQAPQTEDMIMKDAPAPISVKKHGMTATWHHDDPSTWSVFQKALIRQNLLQQQTNTPKPPVHEKTDKVPHYPVYKQWMWIIPRAIISISVHRLFMELTGKTFHPIFAFFL